MTTATPASHELESPLAPHYYVRTDRASESATPRESIDNVRESLEKASAAAASSGKTARRKKRFCCCWRLSRRNWWLATIACVLGALLVAFLLVWFVVLDAIFQHYTDRVNVTLNHFDIVRVSIEPDARVLGVALSLRFTHNLPVEATTEPTNVELAFAGAPFAALALPTLDMAAGAQTYDVVLAGDTQVTDPSMFTALARAVITQPSLSIETRAMMSARAAGISKSGLAFTRTLAFAGLNNFATPPSSINRMTLQRCEPAGLALAINASVDNVAQLGLDGIGALNLSLYYEQSYLGYAVTAMPSLGIPRGRSVQLFNVTINSATAQRGTIASMVQGVAFGRAQFFLSGNTALPTQVALLKEPLAALNVSITYNDRLEKVAFAPTCDLLTLLAFV